MERLQRLAPSGDAAVDAGSRVVRYTFSDESVGRDGHIVKADAWRTENFKKNPVFLWCHSDETPPIGRVLDLRTEGRELRGAVKYAEHEFADTIFQLVRDGFLAAVSTSWQPLAWEPMDKPGGGFVFTDVDLLEISQVAVPALPTALASARARGIDVSPLAAWASRSLDTGRYGGLRRTHLEQLYRAASGARLTLVPSDESGHAARRARAEELAAKFEREERARKLKARGQRELSEANEKKLSEVQAQHARAFKHHRALERHHDKVASGADALSAVHRRLRAALSELGVDEPRVARSMDELQRRIRAVADAKEDCSDAHVRLGDCLAAAQTAVGAVLDGDVEEQEQ